MSEDADTAYTKALSDCATLDDLRALMGRYAELAVDAGRVVATMTDGDMVEFRRGLRQERKGRFAGEAWAERFAAILMPLPMMRVSQIAGEFHVPFAVALRRIKDLRPDLLVVEEPQSADAVDPHAGSTGKPSTRVRNRPVFRQGSDQGEP